MWENSFIELYEFGSRHALSHAQITKQSDQVISSYIPFFPQRLNILVENPVNWMPAIKEHVVFTTETYEIRKDIAWSGARLVLYLPLQQVPYIMEKFMSWIQSWIHRLQVTRDDGNITTFSLSEIPRFILWEREIRKSRSFSWNLILQHFGTDNRNWDFTYENARAKYQTAFTRSLFLNNWKRIDDYQLQTYRVCWLRSCASREQCQAKWKDCSSKRNWDSQIQRHAK